MTRIRLAWCVIGIFWLFFIQCRASAEELPLPQSSTDSVVGEIRSARVHAGESLLDIARAFDIGHDQIIAANPAINRWIPEPGSDVIIPSRYILPPGPRSGIVLNLGELRMYYYPPRSASVLTFPVSIGDLDWRTPIGVTRIISKERDPTWIPPPSIRAEHEAESDSLPPFIPGGDPDNPLGHFAFRLAIKGYLIHSTDERRSFGIGMRVSHGCVRLYPEDAEQLFHVVRVGTVVRIINEPVKFGIEDGEQLIEIHRSIEPELEELSLEELFNAALRKIALSSPNSDKIDPRALARSVILGSGMPTSISSRDTFQ